LNSLNWCIDTNTNHYGIIENDEFTVYEI
jgi:hypothetical protein